MLRLFLAACLLTPQLFAERTAELQAYLDSQPKATIEQIEIGPKQIHIRGKIPTSGEFLLAEIPMERASGGTGNAIDSPLITPVQKGEFSVEIPRFLGKRDRLIGRWQLLEKSTSGWKTASHACYPSQISSLAATGPELVPRSKKGLGGWNAGRIPGELDALGIDAVTVNIVLTSLISLTPDQNTEPFQWQGKTFHAREPALAVLDQTFLQAAQRGAMVSAILLVPNPARESDPLLKVLGHPDADPHGIFAMPNLTTTEGVELYGAVLDLMARRWIRDAATHGRVHHWIMHNEVDAGWEWTNAGEKSDIEYLELYHRSMRMMDLIARQYDPHSRAFISLDHWWNTAGNPRWYGSKRLLDLLAAFSQIEGNFGWGLAFHPYPENLFDPETWQDKQSEAQFNSPQITPRNLEVLDAYMKQPQFLDRGKVRPIQLSENGFNSRDYSDVALAKQAAGMAYAWKKIAGLSSIQTWEYHNWIDHRDEGGLRIGLRKFPDDSKDPLGKKPIWHLYQALGTTNEDAACDPYLKITGIESWTEVSGRQETD